MDKGIFKRDELALGDGPFAKLDLELNPFELPEEEGFQGQLAEPRDVAYIISRMRHIVNKLRLNAAAENPRNFWLIKDGPISRHNIILMLGLFRGLIHSASPSIFASISRLPDVYRHFNRSVFLFFADRLQPDRLRRAIYTLLLDVLDDEAVMARLTELDASLSSLAEKAVADEGRCLDGIFFPPVEETEEDEETAAASPDGEPAEESPQAVQRKKAAAVRSYLVSLVTDAMEQRYGGKLSRIAGICLNKGFETGKMRLEDIKGDRTLVKNLLEFSRLNYGSAVLLLDDMEGWPTLEEMEQADLVGDITQFSFLSKSGCFIVLMGFLQTLEVVPPFVQFEQVPLGLDVLAGDKEYSADKAVELALALLSADIIRQRDDRTDCAPFTRSALELCASSCDEWSSFLKLASNTLEAAARSGVSSIDETAVKASLTVS